MQAAAPGRVDWRQPAPEPAAGAAAAAAAATAAAAAAAAAAVVAADECRHACRRARRLGSANELIEHASSCRQFCANHITPSRHARIKLPV